MWTVTLLVAASLVGQSAHPGPAAWPQFRGIHGRGVADDATFPERWTASENVEWKVDIPGRGWSSPIVWGDHVFLTTVVNLGMEEEPRKGLYFGGNRPQPSAAEHQWKVICLDLASGKILWEQQVFQGQPRMPIHLKNSYASETPVTDGERVYCYFGGLGVFCFDFAGHQVWSKDLEPHAMRFGWGTAASPVLHEDRLYIVNDNDDESYLVALNKRTGQEVWRQLRDEKSNWATPCIWQTESRTEIVTAGTGKVRSYDLDGNLLWSLQGMSSITTATPYSAGDLLYVSSGYLLDNQRPIYAIRSKASGDITLQDEQTSNDSIAWCQLKAAPYNPSTLVYRDRLYVLYDRGIMACYDARTGAVVYEKRRFPDGGAFTASPWASHGKIFCLSEDGVTSVIAAGDEFRVIHSNPLADDDMCMATPAVAGDRLLIRSRARLYCIRGQ